MTVMTKRRVVQMHTYIHMYIHIHIYADDTEGKVDASVYRHSTYDSDYETKRRIELRGSRVGSQQMGARYPVCASGSFIHVYYIYTARIASWNPLGVEPVHWKPADIKPGQLKWVKIGK